MNLVERGSGFPIVFVHGNGVDHRLLYALEPVFDGAPGEWRRIYLDLPGFGSTPALDGPGGLPDIANWLATRLEELIGSVDFALVGNSLGGLLVLDLVRRFPQRVKGLALIAPVVEPDHNKRRVPPKIVLKEDPALIKRLSDHDAELYLEMAVEQSPANWDRFRRFALPGLNAADAGAMERLSAEYRLDESPWLALAGSVCPMLVVCGRQDHIVGYEDQWQRFGGKSRCTLAVLDAAGHNAHLDRSAIVEPLVRDWLAALHDALI